MPIFRSRHQGELLTQLYLHPEREYTSSELARSLGVPVSTAHREMVRLVEAGLTISRPVGRARLHRANVDHPGARALTELLSLSFGPVHIIGDEFAGLDGVQRIVLFGSWAARHHGEDGPPPADVDVLVVGSARRPEVYAAAERAEERLGLPVNPVLRTARDWAVAEDSLVRQVQQSPYLTLLDRSSGIDGPRGDSSSPGSPAGDGQAGGTP